MEEWRDVVGFEGCYQVSNSGGLRSVDKFIGGRWGDRFLAGKILSQYSAEYGRRTINLAKDGNKKRSKVHRLVLEAFVGPCPDGMECCHNNGDASDNRLENLRWGTKKSNTEDMVRHGTSPLGDKRWGQKLSEFGVRVIVRLIDNGNITQTEIASLFGVGTPTICNINLGHRWSWLTGRGQ